MSTEARPFTLASYPTAIIHCDGDAFFTSVEQAVNPALRGKPVVTGKERGIIACASYEAKALGVKRGVHLWDAKKWCPHLVVLPSDYETYSLYSKRMFNIIRRYTPAVEESSIDEGFADLSGLRRVFRTSYQEIAKRIQRDVQNELGITISVGLSLTKGLAKLASDFRKPAGFTAVAGAHIHLFLQRTPINEVWGIGPNTVHLLAKHGVRTAYDFAVRPEAWVKRMLGKVGKEIRNELRGTVEYPVTPDEPPPHLTISKCKTFTSPSSDKQYVYAKLVRNLESAYIKLRRYRLRAGCITVALRMKDFNQEAVEARLNRPTSSTQEAVPVLKELFNYLYRERCEYRTTVVVLSRIEEDRHHQFELFEDRLRVEKLCRVSRVIDEINKQYGKHTVGLGPSLYLDRHRKTARDALPWRKTDLFKGETARQRLNVPRLSIDV